MSSKNKSALEKSAQKGFVFVADGGSEDESIVELGNSSMDAIQPETSSPRVENGQKVTVENLRKLQKELTALTRENLQLKESLEMNHTAMNEHLSALVNRQEELAKVYEAHRQKYADTKNRLKVLEAENDELKANIDALERDNAVQNKQTEEAAGTADKDLSNETMAMAKKCKEQNQEVVHAHRIIASLKDQLECLYQNTFNPIKLEDLHSTGQTQEEPHRQQFLESFAHYNEKLRELGYCYAAQTSRYTSIQNCLHRCNEILLTHENPTTTEESRESSRSKMAQDLQDCRGALVDEESKMIAEREEMIRAQNEYQKIFIDYNSMIFEVESLRKDIERLNGALQSAVALRDERHNKTEAAVKEMERLVEEKRGCVERDRQDLLAEKTELERSIEASASGLRERESLLEDERNALKKDRNDLSAEREQLERFAEANARIFNDERSSLEEQRRALEQDRRDLLTRTTELSRLAETNANDTREKERSLEEQRKTLEKDRNDFLARIKKVEQFDKATAERLSDLEKSLEERQRALEQERLDFMLQKRGSRPSNEKKYPFSNENTFRTFFK